MLASKGREWCAVEGSLHVFLAEPGDDMCASQARPLLEDVLLSLVASSESQGGAEIEGFQGVGLIASLGDFGQLKKTVRSVNGPIVLERRPPFQGLEVGVMKLEA